jgi:competence ComEA-like helix-hairpin-helix protein
MKRQIIHYFSITKKEWNGTIVLVIAILLVLIALYVYQKLHKDKPINFKEFDKAAAILSAGEKKSGINANTGKSKPSVLTYSSNKLKSGETIELNTADSTALTRIHGIGPSFARRIIAYRKKLGGFMNNDQLKEVYGLDAEKYAEISDEIWVDASGVKKLAINSIDFETLRHFPYLSYKQANAVIQYRVQHGDYRSLNDMRDIALLNDEILSKIAPYISFK